MIYLHYHPRRLASYLESIYITVDTFILQRITFHIPGTVSLGKIIITSENRSHLAVDIPYVKMDFPGHVILILNNCTEHYLTNISVLPTFPSNKYT